MPSSISRLAVALLVSGSLAACAPPLLQFTNASPAMVQAQVSHANIIDRRAQFREVFCRLVKRDRPNDRLPCDHWLQRFSDEPQSAVAVPPLDGPPTVNIVIVSGIFNECLPQVPAFGDAVEGLRASGYHVSYAPIKGRASSETNAAVIRAHLAAQRDIAPKRPVLILGYSKGLADTLTALAAYPEVADTVAAVIGVAGVVNGSPVADQLLELYQATAGLVPNTSCPINDGGELRSLTRDFRLNWLATHTLPARPLYFSLAGVPAPDRVSAVFSTFYRSLSRVDPRNDGQMIYYDAVLPGSVLLGYPNADHFAIALPFESAMPVLARLGVDHNDFPRTQMVAAAVRMAEAALLGQASRKARK